MRSSFSFLLHFLCLRRAILLRWKAFFSPAYRMLKRLFVFKGFVIQLVKSLSLDEREAFRFWCLGIIPGSKLDANLSNGGEMLKLIEFLCNDDKLYFTDLSLLRKFLSSVGRCDMLEKLKRVELCIAVGCIVEDYIRSVNGFQQISRYTNIVETLATTREGNQELISSIIEVPSREVNDNDKILDNLDSAILDSQLSWSRVISSLLIMGELYVSFRPVHLAENGDYVNMFYESRASKCLTVWMLENGGLVSKTRIIICHSVLYCLS